MARAILSKVLVLGRVRPLSSLAMKDCAVCIRVASSAWDSPAAVRARTMACATCDAGFRGSGTLMAGAMLKGAPLPAHSRNGLPLITVKGRSPRV